MPQWGTLQKPPPDHSHYRTKQSEPHAKKNAPYFIGIVTIVDIVLFIWTLTIDGFAEPIIKNPLLGPSVEVLVVAGAKYGHCIKTMNMWWRLLTPMFLHVGIIHILMNLYMQVRVGADLERTYGLRIVPIYLGAGFLGNLLSVVFIPEVPSVGASSSLFGLVGLLLIDLIKSWKKLANPMLALVEYLCQLICILALGMLPMIDNFAHIGGFIAGILLSFVMIPNIRSTLPKRGPKQFEDWTADCRFFSCRILEMIFFSFIFIIVCLFLLSAFYVSEDPDGWCDGCAVINCIPLFDWCDFAHPAEPYHCTDYEVSRQNM